jgi:hypothetical protein
MIVHPILAHGETAILPGLILIALVISVSAWTVFISFRWPMGRLLMACAVGLTLVGATALVILLIGASWPLESAEIFSLLFWSIPVICGIASLVKGTRIRKS